MFLMQCGTQYCMHVSTLTHVLLQCAYSNTRGQYSYATSEMESTACSIHTQWRGKSQFTTLTYQPYNTLT